MQMAKYDALAERLLRHRGAEATFSFAELDRLVGGLPPSARTDRTWWGNTTNRTRVQSRAWIGARWQVDGVNLLTQRVTFRRADHG
jgi:hypothetical protein